MGCSKYDGDESSLRDEKIRQEKLEQAGLIVVRWGSADLSAFDRVEQRLRSAFKRGSRPGSSRRTWNVLPAPTLTPPMTQDVLRYVIGGVKVG